MVSLPAGAVKGFLTPTERLCYDSGSEEPVGPPQPARTAKTLSVVMKTCYVVTWDRIAYAEALAHQLRVVRRLREGDCSDAVLMLLEHNPVVTLGRGARVDHLRLSPEELVGRGVEVCETTRGGDVTYHGPGQLVGYPILRLPEDRRDVHRYLRSLEAVIVRALAAYGISAGREPGLTGVWVEGGKIAAIGVAFTRWVAYHGFALNITTDISAFGFIVPCGIPDRPVVSIEKVLGWAPARREVEDRLVEEFACEFAFERVERCGSFEELPPHLR